MALSQEAICQVLSHCRERAGAPQTNEEDVWTNNGAGKLEATTGEPLERSPMDFAHLGDFHKANMSSRVCSLEILVGVLERMAVQEHKLEQVVDDVTSIKSALAGMRNISQDGRLTISSPNVSELASEFFQLKQNFMHVQADVLALQERETLAPEQRPPLEENAADDRQQGLPERLPKREPTPDSSRVTATTSRNFDRHSAESSQGTKTMPPSIALERQMDAYTLNESVWDYCLLIGMRETGVLASAFIALLVFVNAFIQIALCLIINDMFTESEIHAGQVDAMRQWRVVHGHSLYNMDPTSMQPFVQGVCTFKDGMHTATEAASIYATIMEYLPTEQYYNQREPMIGPLLPYTWNIGVVMSSIALIIWICTIIDSVEKCWEGASGVMNVPLGESTVIFHGSDSRILKCMTLARRVGYSMVALVQIVVEVCLALSGVFYIIRTLGLRDLLLNCSALTIVLELDELFATFVPRKPCLLLRSLEPLPRPMPRHWLGMSRSSLFKSAILIIGMAFASWQLNLQVQVLKDTRDEICGGNLDFLVAIDSTGVVVGSKPPDFEEKDPTKTYMFDAVSQLVHDLDGNFVVTGLSKEDMSAFSTGVRGGAWSLEAWIAQDAEETIGYWNRNCEDMLPVASAAQDYAVHFLRILSEVVQNEFLQDCSEVRSYCSFDGIKGMWSRKICPVTCGCNDPYGVVVAGMNGCSPGCRRTTLYNDSMWSRECKDLEVDSPIWSNYIDSLDKYLSAYRFAWTEQDARLVTEIKRSGCGAIWMNLTVFGIDWHDRCEVESEIRLKPFTYACPVSCQCKGNDRFLCPNVCRFP